MDTASTVEEVYEELFRERRNGEALDAGAVSEFVSLLPEWNWVVSKDGLIFARRIDESDPDSFPDDSNGSPIRIHRVESGQLLAYVKTSEGIHPEHLQAMLELEDISPDSTVPDATMEKMRKGLEAVRRGLTLEELEALEAWIEIEKARARKIVEGFGDREREVLSQFDLPYKQIALNMGIGVSSVRTHVHNMMRSAEIGSSVDLLLVAFQSGELSTESQPGQDETFEMSDRERTLARLSTFTYKEIAERMELSVSTIRTHLHNLMGKVGIGYSHGLVAALVREGAVPIEEFERHPKSKSLLPKPRA